MARIRILPDHLVTQIAAGEVVERPASVVKELVENSLDAGAGRITVELEGGGAASIRVLDDGFGMEAEDARLAFDRHATSKLRGLQDLQEISTLGFRGEALAAIAAVSRAELATAARAGEGLRVRMAGGRLDAVEPVSRPRGTAVEVADLFFNVPARRKFLRSVGTEQRRALEVVQGYALARPEVHFTAVADGRERFDLPAVGGGAEGVRERVLDLFGPALAAALEELPERRTGAGRIWGLLGGAGTARSRRQFVFVNRRLIRDRALLSSFYRAVRATWKRDEYPALFLFLDLPSEVVDVNVHPQKAEVRFRDPAVLRSVYGVLVAGLEAARSEGEAPLSPANVALGPGVWQGLGAVRAPGPAGASSVAEDGTAAPPRRLAEATYPPADPRPVRLSGRAGEERPFRLLGQYKGTIVLLEGPDGLYLVDQHVAHERILYDRLRRALEQRDVARQSLLTPLLLELSPVETLRLRDLAEELAACGFDLTELSGGAVGVTAAPAILTGSQAEGLLRSLAAGGGIGGGGAEGLRSALLDSLAASQACRRAVKMHDVLTPSEMERMVTELFASEQPFACPHGRPTILRMTDADLERRFGRR